MNPASAKPGPVAVTVTNFEQMTSEPDAVVLLDFWAPWCVPCNLMKRSVEKAAFALAGLATVGLVNVDVDPLLAERFGVRGTPTFVLLRGGQVVTTFSGMVTSGGLVDRVRNALR